MSELKLETTEQQASYGVGCQMGQQLLQNGFDGVELEAVIAGLTDGYLGQQLQLPVDQIQAALTEINKALQEKQIAKAKLFHEEGQAFLAENGNRDEVTVLESGLQYEVIESGEGGDKPTRESTVRTHYHGTFIDGNVFDSSYERGTPIEFPVTGVIAGWTEALQMMSKGDKWKLYVPYNLAYGEQGSPGGIPPYATLIFDVELIDIL